MRPVIEKMPQFLGTADLRLRDVINHFGDVPLAFDGTSARIGSGHLRDGGLEFLRRGADSLADSGGGHFLGSDLEVVEHAQRFGGQRVAVDVGNHRFKLTELATN